MIARFVVGTDTGVGKTTVAAALLAAAAARGLRAACLKPAESGCDRREGRLFAADAALLVRATQFGGAPAGSPPISSTARVLAAGAARDPAAACVYRFEEAVAPGVAAEREGVEIDFARIRAAYDELRAQEPDLLLIEGAGGLLVPMGSGRLLVDLVQLLEAPLVVIGRAGLGTINHTLLTLEAASARDLAVAGVVLSSVEPLDPTFAASNAVEIERASGVRVLGLFPHLEEPSLPALARCAEQTGILDAVLGSPTASAADV